MTERSGRVTLAAENIHCLLSGQIILDGASLSLTAGRITALLGPSGSGKTTLLRVLAGLEDIKEGSVTCAERVLTRPGERVAPEHRRIGIVFQDYALFPHLTARGNVAFGLAGLTRRAAARLASEALDAVGLAERAGAYPHELSGGEQQRVALARALAPQPNALLMDEPFSNLDRGLRRSLSRRTADLLHASGAAVLIVTHDAEEAMLLADELALMHRGRIIQTGSPEDVYLHPVSARAASLTGDVNVWQGRAQDGQALTPFGPVAVAADNGTPVSVMLRPEFLTATPAVDGLGVIAERRLHGPAVLLDIDASGERWRARGPIDTPGQPGDRVHLTAPPARLHTVVRKAPARAHRP